MTAEQALAAVNAAWSANGETPFTRTARGGGAPGLSACGGLGLCLLFTAAGSAVNAVSLTGPAEGQAASARYLSAQALLIQLTAPGAPFRPALTADRLAVSDMQTAEAQLGLTCMRVQRLSAGSISTTFSRRRCGNE